ncbi:MAG: hypothetical protein ACLQVG_03685 [Terriglobia bacterium]
MNATRILKEARPLLWLWCAAALAGALPLVYPLDWIAPIYLVGLLAVPVLATLSLGNEFQDRTFSLLLSQPVGRMRIWGEKLSVSVVAIASAVLIFSLALRATSFHPGRQELLFATAWIVAITASATFWTLFTRSAIGGLALNFGVHAFIALAIPWATLADGLRARGYLTPSNVIAVPAAGIIGYAGLMLWLGGRLLTRFQATGGMAGDDLLLAGWDVAPGVVVGWLRCRPSGAVLNLIRKELRLLRPVWLISLMAAAGWACLTLFGVLYERGYSRNFETTLIGMGVVSTLMIAILAGSMSLGEERTSGTHSWHLTLPVSAFRQWLIKLCMALLAGLVGAGLLPLLIARRFIGSSHVLVDVHLGMRLPLVVLGLTFAAFWCACAVNGTVGAVVWVLPAILAIGCTTYFGEFLASGFVHFILAKFGPITNLRLAITASELWPFYRRSRWAYGAEPPLLTLTLATVLLLASIQSYRLYRSHVLDRSRVLIRSLLPLAMTAILLSFSLAVLSAFVIRACWQMVDLFGQSGSAIERILPLFAASGVKHPLQLNVDDLAKASRFPLEESTRLWLRDSRITVTPDKAHPGGYYCETSPVGWKTCYYSATIHLANGADLTLTDTPPEIPKFPFGHVTGYIQWPGAKGRELVWDW